MRACYVKVEDDGMHLSLFLVYCRVLPLSKLIGMLYGSQVVVSLEMNWFYWGKNMVGQNFLRLVLFVCFSPYSVVPSVMLN